MDKDMAVISVSLDYSKAFNVLDHSLLCVKLHYLGFHAISYPFFLSCLTGRKQHVRINNFLSSAGDIVPGVPQGPILGPLLFLFNTFDIFNSVQNSRVQAYADGTHLLHYFDLADPDSATIQLNTELASILQYLNANNLKTWSYI